MKIVNKYIVSNFVSTFYTYLFITAFLIFINYIYQILNSLLLHRPNSHIILNLLLHLLPSVLSLTIPITFLLSVIMCLSILNENKEILTLHTMGLSKIYYTKYLLLISSIIAVLLVYFNGYIVPRSYKNFKFIYFKQIVSKPFISFQNNGVINLQNKKIYTQKVEKDSIFGVYIHNFIDDTSIQTIYAKKANIYADINGNLILYLFDGKITMFNPQLPNEILNLVFKQYKFFVYKSEINKFIPYNKTFREMDNRELLEEFNNSQLPKYKKLVLSEYFLRYTLSFSVLFFSIIGIYLGTKIKKSARSVSFVVSILVILIYYFLLSTSITIIERIEELPLSFISVGTVMQIPNFTMILLCVFISISQKIYENIKKIYTGRIF
ncbi:MAG: LptF/LptG family permease [Elusimicrobiota bacterium]|nr:LptF/LptG family permease [Endomicrobiia bacterium]MDW8165384.1 LptF/LptG family permease [Elusimicrobiota bacterium]